MKESFAVLFSDLRKTIVYLESMEPRNVLRISKPSKNWRYGNVFANLLQFLVRKFWILCCQQNLICFPVSNPKTVLSSLFPSKAFVNLWRWIRVLKLFLFVFFLIGWTGLTHWNKRTVWHCSNLLNFYSNCSGMVRSQFVGDLQA